jgi:DNA-binding response OmpR family regulator
MEKIIKILLAHADFYFGTSIKKIMENNGYYVTYVCDGATAFKVFQKTPHDICLLDMRMPQKNGFETTKLIRQYSESVPILLLTARSYDEDKIKGYKVGADIVLCQPFPMEELLMRLNVFIRRSKRPNETNTNIYTLGASTFDIQASRLFNKDGDELHYYTCRQREVLQFFCENHNKTIRREELLYHVWGKVDFFVGRSMDVVINKIRKSLSHEPSVILETVHGIGYRFGPL